MIKYTFLTLVICYVMAQVNKPEQKPKPQPVKPVVKVEFLGMLQKADAG